MALDLVIDTNVALDLLVFRDPAVHKIYEALQARRAIWLSCEACRDEFLRVIDYQSVHGFLKRRGLCASSRRAEALGEFDSLSTTVARPMRAPSQQPTPRCRDRDDQFLVDFAVVARADFLLSKDRHLIELAKWFARSGRRPTILSPAEFIASGDLPRH